MEAVEPMERLNIGRTSGIVSHSLKEATNEESSSGSSRKSTFG